MRIEFYFQSVVILERLAIERAKGLLMSLVKPALAPLTATISRRTVLYRKPFPIMYPSQKYLPTVLCILSRDQQSQLSVSFLGAEARPLIFEALLIRSVTPKHEGPNLSSRIPWALVHEAINSSMPAPNSDKRSLLWRQSFLEYFRLV